MAIMADDVAKQGKSKEEISRFLKEIRPKVKTSFLIDKLDYLTYVGKVSKWIGTIAGALSMHPVMVMKNDALVMGGVKFGNMADAKESYIKEILKNKNKIDTRRVYVGTVGIKQKEKIGLEHRLATEGKFETVVIRRASAAISINCGVGTFGIIYVER